MHKNKCNEIERNDNRNRYSDSTTTNNLREKEKKNNTERSKKESMKYDIVFFVKLLFLMLIAFVL